MARFRGLLLLSLLLLHAGAYASHRHETLDVAIAGNSFSLELALTPEARYRGLSNRLPIPAGTGMLFAFPAAGPVSFCMRDCDLPIDILFLDPQGRLLSWGTMAPEPRRPGESDSAYNARLTPYPSPPGTQFVIELAGGTLQTLKVGFGELIITVPRALIARSR